MVFAIYNLYTAISCCTVDPHKLCALDRDFDCDLDDRNEFDKHLGECLPYRKDADGGILYDIAIDGPTNYSSIYDIDGDFCITEIDQGYLFP